MVAEGIENTKIAGLAHVEDGAAAHGGHESHGPLAAAALTALGIVYGDIGTSPLYTFRVVLDAAGGGVPTPGTAIGALSLIIWSLVMVISVKYVAFVMRADNNGEGGILALMSLIDGKSKRAGGIVLGMGLFGATLLYGDGVITPAISVLSALEGLKVAMPSLAQHVLPMTVVILVGLFCLQSKGTAVIGKLFGPVMCCWFLVLALLGVRGIMMNPAVLMAFDPHWGLALLFHNPLRAMLILGGVFLAVTGGEALYADMGHIGARPIRAAWFFMVLPALVLNYAGQAAYIIAEKVGGDDNPFFLLAPSWASLPLVVLSTFATIIASQAVISGAFSLTRQAIQLGWCPRLPILQTSAAGYGQIYVPFVNWGLMVLTVALAVVFGSSDRLAAAYGIAVSTTMLLTTLLLYKAMHLCWHWRLLLVLPVISLFVAIDGSFLIANMVKLMEGGWLPLAFGLAIWVMMSTWKAGSHQLQKKMEDMTEPVDAFLGRLVLDDIARVPGTGIFLTKTYAATPPILLHHVRTNKALPKTVLCLTVETEPVPRVSAGERLKIETIAPNFWRCTAHYGFMQTPSIPVLLRHCVLMGCTSLDLHNPTYYVGHETILPSPNGEGMARWREALFALMYRNSGQVTDFFRLPRDQVVEIGRQVEL